MRSVPLILVCALAGLAQPPAEPFDLAIQAVWQAHNDRRWQDVAAARQHAHDLLQGVSPASPRFADWAQQLSQTYQAAGQTGQARMVIEEALARSAPLGNRAPANASLLFALGDSWSGDGNLLKAVTYLEQAVAMGAPASAQQAQAGVFVSGRNFVRRGYYAGAANPAVYSYIRLAELYRSLGRPDAVAALEAKIRAISPDGDFAVAQFYEQSGRLKDAADLFSGLAAKSTEPQFTANLWQSVARLYERQEKPAESAEALRKAIAALQSSNEPMFRNQTTWIRQNLAQTLAGAGQTAEGDQIFQQLLAENGSGPEALQVTISYAQYLSNSQRQAQAEGILKRTLEEGGLDGQQTSQVLYNLAGLAQQRGESDTAEGLRKRAEELQSRLVPQRPAVSIEDDVNQANQAIAQHRLEDAYSHTLRALNGALSASDQQVVWLVTRLANELSAAKQGAKAEQVFHRLFAVTDSWKEETVMPAVSARQSYAQFLMNQHDRAADLPAALEQYRSILAEVHGPESAALAEPLRMALRACNHASPPGKRDEAARELLEMQIRLSGDTSEPYLRDLQEVARAYKNSGDAAAALPLMRKAIAIADLVSTPNNPWGPAQVRIETAWTLVDLKQFDEAAALAAQAVAAAPPNVAKDLAQQLAQIRQQQTKAAAPK